MTYQNLTEKHDDNADEASSLLLTLAGGVGVAATQKKTHGVPRRLMIATTCFLLGTLAVIYYGGSDSSSSSTASSVGISAALLLDHNQAAPLYDSNTDYCFKSKAAADEYCWYPTDSFPEGPFWKGVDTQGNNNCGPKCTSVENDNDDGGNAYLHFPKIDDAFGVDGDAV